jgi:mRNA-degrading endonuclease RelE of RelBE toxin-antitoxin system
MTFSLKILRSARKQLDKLDDKLARVIYEHIEELKEDPYRPRSRMDIIKIEGDRMPPVYRLRIGRWRVEYAVLDNNEILIAKIFPRRRDSDYK